MKIKREGQEAPRVPSFRTLKITSLCSEAGKFDYEVFDTSKPPHFYNAALVIDCILCSLAFDVRDAGPVTEYMRTGYERLRGFGLNEQSRKLSFDWDIFRIMRYLNSEGRKPHFFPGYPKFVGTRCILAPGGEVTMRGHTVLVAPHAIFEFGTGKDKGAELVIFLNRKPEYGSTRRAKKNAEERDLQLYAMVLWARQLGYKFIKASFYYLKKASDTTRSKTACEPGFFGTNVISLEDVYEGKPNKLDKEMAPYLDLLDKGIPCEKISEETCRSCSNYDLCRFQKAPLHGDAQKGAWTSRVAYTPQQQEAVTFTKGVGRVNAGPGSGKTKTAVGNVEYMVEQGEDPASIVVLTLTNAAADEFRQRLIRQCPKAAGAVVSTYHAFEYKIVKENPGYFGFKKAPSVNDPTESKAINDKILTENPIYEWQSASFLFYENSGKKGPKGAVKIMDDVFSVIKAMNPDDVTKLTPKDLRQAGLVMPSLTDDIIARIIELYDLRQQLMKEKNLVDFDDMKFMAFKFLDDHPGYLEKRYGFKHIIVDECQDTTPDQQDFFMRLMAMSTNESTLIVGDDDQSIYGFQGADPQLMIDFAKKAGKPVRDFYLLDNFRSTPEIISFVNDFIGSNSNRIVKKLVAAAPAGGAPVKVLPFKDKKEEMKGILKEVQRLNSLPGTKAIIAYDKATLASVGSLLTENGFKTKMEAGQPMLENSRVKGLLAFCRVIADPRDTRSALLCANALLDGALREASNEERDKAVASVVAVAQAVDAAGTLAGKKALFMDFAGKLVYEDAAMERLMDSFESREYDEILAYCRDFERFGDEEEYKDRPGAGEDEWVLVTAHSSKGREYDHVINTVSTYQRLIRMKLAQKEELRRLAFVSFTRAKKTLVITGQTVVKRQSSAAPSLIMEECCALAGIYFDGSDQLSFDDKF